MTNRFIQKVGPIVGGNDNFLKNITKMRKRDPILGQMYL